MGYEAALREHYAEVRERLWKPQRAARSMPALTIVPRREVFPAPKPAPVYQEWPPYTPPLPYDHCDGSIPVKRPPPRRLTIRVAGEHVELPDEIRAIVDAVCSAHRVGIRDLRGNARHPNITRARYDAYYRMRHELSLSFSAIGKLFRKDHTSVIHGYWRHRKGLGKVYFPQVFPKIHREPGAPGAGGISVVANASKARQVGRSGDENEIDPSTSVAASKPGNRPRKSVSSPPSTRALGAPS